jgi:hypothetical protein
MLEREAKREKNLEKRAIELARRARATEAESKTAEKAASGKDEKMEEILRRVDGEFLSLIKVRGKRMGGPRALVVCWSLPSGD